MFQPQEVTVREFIFDPNDTDTLFRLRQMPVFDAMDAGRLPYVLQMAKLRRYDAGETIIREGETDQTVYFLILGRCTVEVDGLQVNAIQNVGDVFGEMGIIDHAPRSATIKAEKPVLCLAMDGHFLDKLEGIDKLAAQALFYRIFSEMLAARMRDANAKILELEHSLEKLSAQ